MSFGAKLKIGASAPPFDLPGVDGKHYSLQSFKDKPVLVVMFTCNHCPYAQAYEDRIIRIQADYLNRGVQLVAINPNDETDYPDDSFENMVLRAKRKSYNFPYLHDGSQEVALAYGAQRTPEVYVFDSKRQLRYHGRIDDNWRELDKVKVRDLRDAIDAVLAGRQVKEPEKPAVGCTVKWSAKMYERFA